MGCRTGAAGRILGAPPELDPGADREVLASGARAEWGIGHPIPNWVFAPVLTLPCWILKHTVLLVFSLVSQGYAGSSPVGHLGWLQVTTVPVSF